jgi:hypothetical protein
MRLFQEFDVWDVRHDITQLFQERGIILHELSAVSVQRGGDSLDIDLLAVNSTEAVIAAVRHTLRQADIDEHLERLSKFKRLMPRYQDVRSLGAVAAMVVPPEVARYAYRQGLFVLAQSDDDMAILNDADFRPKTW